MAINPFIDASDDEDDRDNSHKLVETADGRLHLFSNDTADHHLERFKWRYDNGQDVSPSANMQTAQPLHSFADKSAFRRTLDQFNPSKKAAHATIAQYPIDSLGSAGGLLSRMLPSSADVLTGDSPKPVQYTEHKAPGIMSDVTAPGEGRLLSKRLLGVQEVKASNALNNDSGGIQKVVVTKKVSAPAPQKTVTPRYVIPNYNKFPAGPHWDLIGKNESPGRLDAYRPNKGNSGVTIATGVDLGQWDERSFRKLGVPQTIIDKVRDAFGLKGKDAQQFLNDHKDDKALSLTEDEVVQLDTLIANDFYKQVTNAYDRSEMMGVPFKDLPPDAQTTILDVAHQRGPHLWALGKTKPFWRMITSGQWEMAKDELKRLGYPERHRAEWLGKAIDANNLPRVPGWVTPEVPEVRRPEFEIED